MRPDPERTVEQLREMGIWPEDEPLTTERKKEILTSLLSEGNADLANAVAQLPLNLPLQDVTHVPGEADAFLSVGQVWLSPEGVAYHLAARNGNRWQVEVTNTEGPTTASVDEPWLFHEHKLVELLAKVDAHLYDPTDRLDTVAERLEEVGLGDIAGILDDVRADYIGARSPKNIRFDRQQRNEKEIETLRLELEKSTDQDEIERITNRMDQLIVEMKEDMDRVQDADDIRPQPGALKDGNITEPNLVSKP